MRGTALGPIRRWPPRRTRSRSIPTASRSRAWWRRSCRWDGRAEHSATMNLVYRMVRGAFRLFFRSYGRWEVIGRENVPATGAVIITPNHVSYLDPPLIGSAIDRECRFMARHDLWDKKIMFWLMPRMGGFPVHRGKMDRQAIRL